MDLKQQINYNNGDYYKGEIKGGKAYGKGILYYKNENIRINNLEENNKLNNEENEKKRNEDIQENNVNEILTENEINNSQEEYKNNINAKSSK